jgi:hypothetical protein
MQYKLFVGNMKYGTLCNVIRRILRCYYTVRTENRCALRDLVQACIDASGDPFQHLVLVYSDFPNAMYLIRLSFFRQYKTSGNPSLPSIWGVLPRTSREVRPTGLRSY